MWWLEWISGILTPGSAAETPIRPQASASASPTLPNWSSSATGRCGRHTWPPGTGSKRLSTALFRRRSARSWRLVSCSTRGPGSRNGCPDSVLPVIRTILESGSKYTAVDVFSAEHRLGELRTEVAQLWQQMDVLVLPAIGTTFTVDEVLADPIGANTKLGHYTHFGNLLDLCAVVVPAGLTSDGRPAAIMILGPALADDRVLGVAAELTGVEQLSVASPATVGPPSQPVTQRASLQATTTLVVAGHHMTGQPREVDLVSRGGSLTAATLTAPVYRLLRVGENQPVPALVHVDTGGVAIEVETWSLPAAALGEILSTASR